MNETAREQILENLNSAIQASAPQSPELPYLAQVNLSSQKRIELLQTNLESVRAHVRIASSETWIDYMLALLGEKEVKTLLISPKLDIGENGCVQLIPYVTPIELFKKEIFAVDASITSAWGAVAENGAIILCPDEKEPRLMSLVPPIHIAVLPASRIFSSFSEIMEENVWSGGLPTNLLFISGPSKTADIELVLAYGVHGPKEFIVFIIKDM